MDARTFTGNDWACLAGASRFANGDEPLIGTPPTDLIVVAGGDGVQVHTNDADSYMLPGVTFPTASAAGAFIDGLPYNLTEDGLAEFGFVAI